MRPRPRSLALVVLALASVPLLAAPAVRAGGRVEALTIDVFSMGQADAMLIAGPERSVLVDCGAPVGGRRDGWRRVADAIRRRTGKAAVDWLVITHFHEDHMGEAADRDGPASGIFGLLGDGGVTVGAILDHGDRYPQYGKPTYPWREYADAIPGWRRAGVFRERRVPKVGEVLALGGGAVVKVVSVNGSGAIEAAAARGRFRTGARPSENDYSIALTAGLGDFELFSGGDMSGEDTYAGRRPRGRSIYTDVESRVRDAVGNVEVLRANHHGSGHSTNDEFADTLRPEVSIVSCGEDNPFGHPSEEAVSRLAPFGPVLVTSGLASSWRRRSQAPVVAGDIEIEVGPGGATYTVKGSGNLAIKNRSFSDEEEALGRDGGGLWKWLAGK